MINWFILRGDKCLKIKIENAMSNLTFYERFIPLNFQKMIEESPTRFTVLGARSENEYAGLIIAKKSKKASLMKIIYLVVSEWNKNTGLEEMFLYLLEDIARVEKIQYIHFEYIGDRNGYFQYIDGLLRKNSWSLLKPNYINYLLRRKAIANELRINKHFKSNHELLFFEWGLLSLDEQLEIVEGEGKWYPKKHSPSFESEKIEKSSIGVRFNGKVIGWFLIQRLKKQTILVKSIYLKEEFRNEQNSIQLLIIGLIQSLKLHNWQYMRLHIDDDNKQLQTFLERVLRRAIQNKTIVYSSMKKVL